MNGRMRDVAVGAVAAAALMVVGMMAVGMLVGATMGGVKQAGSSPRLPSVFAVTSQADDSFAVCTVPLDVGVEGFFMLDFETGDLSGGVLSPNTSQFAGSYKHNVLKDLGFKAGQAKNPRFLLVSGAAELRRGGATFAPSVLYVTDSSTGTTVAYGIPWNTAQPQLAVPLVPLDVARPRGGGAKVK
ncbi:MAG: hypothetical protein ACKOHG_04950 [Planctomycetia bacterium]